MAAAGISPNFEYWHIARHDVYGKVFVEAWQSDVIENNEEPDIDILQN